MNEEEINKMCSDIYEGEDWQPMKDYIKSLQTQLQQKENIIKEVREYIENDMKLKDNFMIDEDGAKYLLEILDKEVIKSE